MSDLDPGLLREWRWRALARGETADRVIAPDAPEPTLPSPEACSGCDRDAPTLRAIGHRPGCGVAGWPRRG